MQGWFATREQDDGYSGQLGKTSKPLHHGEAIPFHAPAGRKMDIEDDQFYAGVLGCGCDCHRIGKRGDVETVRLEPGFECVQDG